MQNIKYLITTSSKSVLLKHVMDRAVYLNYACIPYSKERELESYKVAPPYGLEPAKAHRDFELAQHFYKALLKDISELLNNLHSECHDERYWEIVLGHWLWRFVKVAINRYKTIEQICELHEKFETATYKDYRCSLAVLDGHSAVLAFRSDRWNHDFYETIIKGYFHNKFKFIYIESGQVSSSNKKINILAGIKFWKNIKKEIFNFYNFTAQKLSYSDKFFFISTYLPKFSEFIFHIHFAQLPKLWRSVIYSPQKINFDQKLRDQLSEKISRPNKEGLTAFLREVVFQSIPYCHLEGYKELKNEVDSSYFPKNPKIIFTANNFDMDEYFKLWAAQKIESGSIYIAAQHGGVYGSYKYVNNPSIEERTSDYFMTWGWNGDKHIPSCILNGKKLRGIKSNSAGYVTLIQAVERERVETHDVTYEYRNYFNDQKDFVRSLIQPIKNNLVVRLGPDYQTRLQFEDLRWADFDSSIKIDHGKTDINKIYSNSRLIVQSYDSTGFLETLSLNIPTIAFWRNPLSHLRPSAIPYYKILLDAGILCDEKSAANLVNCIYDDVYSWWNSDKVQGARIKFCENFARQVPSRTRELKKFFKSLEHH